MTYSRFCQGGIVTPASAATAIIAIGTQNRQLRADDDVRASAGNRLSREVAARSGGSGTTAATSAPQAAAVFNAGSTTARRAAAKSIVIVLRTASRSTIAASKYSSSALNGVWRSRS